MQLHDVRERWPFGGSPAALPYSQSLSSVQQVQTPRWQRRLVRWLLIVLVVTAGAILLLPWQQTVTGKGRVIALSPVERPQSVDAPISGRVMKWYVLEGSRVRAGDPLFEVQNNDPEWLARLEQQRVAALGKVAAATEKVARYRAQVSALQEGQNQDVASAREKARAAEQAVAAARQIVAAAEAVSLQAQLNFQRQRDLAAEGIAAQLDFEIARRTWETAQADVLAKQASLQEKQADLAAKQFDVQKINLDDQAKIESAHAAQREAEGDLSAAQSDLAKAETSLAQQQTSLVHAPRDGTVFRLLQAQGTAQVKEGDAIASLVPDTDQPAVELFMQGLDTPLVAPGQSVRLQFEGWPAVQIAGWPSVAVGMFAGVVRVVDAADDGKGKFRVLVVPDPRDGTWPSHRQDPGGRGTENNSTRNRPWGRFASSQATYLRQGVRVNGWVRLRRVPLWFEVWRRFNGFPPAIADESRTVFGDTKTESLAPDKQDKKEKPPVPK